MKLYALFYLKIQK